MDKVNRSVDLAVDGLLARLELSLRKSKALERRVW